jgi:ABC-type dipeptide/oligopeptide/nickel transport system permease component
LIKRTAYTILLIFFVIVLNWVIFEAMPGATGNIYAVLGQNGKLPPGEYQRQMALYGLDQPYWVRFYLYVKALLTFQFGFSYQSNQDVTQQMISTGRLANTLELLGTSTLLALVIGTVIGVIVSRRRGSATDNLSVVSSLTTFSLPTFFMGTLLIFLFAGLLGWFPSGGTHPNQWDNINVNLKPDLFTQYLVRLQYLFLPALTLTLFSYGGFLLLTRATMGEALSEDYIVTARAKGLTERAILFKHAFKNASLPLITNAALSFGAILSGAIITETIFNWDGLGKWLYDAIGFKDFPVMEAMFYIIALCVIAANFVSDILYGIVDPRIRYD